MARSPVIWNGTTGKVLPVSGLVDYQGNAIGGMTNPLTTTGDTIYSSSGTTPARLGIGTAEQILAVSSTGIPYWVDRQGISNGYVYSSDLFSTNAIGADLLAAANGAGASAAGSSAYTSANPGVFDLKTGTTTTGSALLMNNTASTLNKFIGAGQFFFEVIVKVDTLADATETYGLILGITNTFSLAPANAIFIRYQYTENSGKYTLMCRNTSTESTSDMGTAVSTTTFHRVGFIVNAAGTSVQGYVGGVAGGTAITTNIPASTTAMQVEAGILKSAGTTSRTLAMDAIRYGWIPTTAR